jgi:hypothetical protein
LDYFLNSFSKELSMNNIALGAALVLTVLSWSAVADERDSMHGKATMEEQCKAMAQQHGMQGDKLDAWVDKCLEIAAKMHHGRETGDNNAMNDGGDRGDDNGVRDSDEGDSAMSDEGK